MHKVPEFREKDDSVKLSMKKKVPPRLKKKLDYAALVAVIQGGRSFSDFGKSGSMKFLGLALTSKKNS